MGSYAITWLLENCPAGGTEFLTTLGYLGVFEIFRVVERANDFVTS